MCPTALHGAVAAHALITDRCQVPVMKRSACSCFGGRHYSCRIVGRVLVQEPEAACLLGWLSRRPWQLWLCHSECVASHTAASQQRASKAACEASCRRLRHQVPSRVTSLLASIACVTGAGEKALKVQHVIHAPLLPLSPGSSASKSTDCMPFCRVRVATSVIVGENAVIRVQHIIHVLPAGGMTSTASHHKTV